MLIKNLTIIILNDRQDQIFQSALISAAVAEEIIVFDQESNNDWPKLEKILKTINPQLNFRVIIRKNPITDFANLRNKVIKKVNTPWLLFLDSDEILSKNKLNTLSQLLSNDQISAYRLQRVDYFHGHKMRFGETGKNYSVRLARINRIKYQRQVHEIAHISGRVENSNLIIKHFPHQNLTSFIKSVNKYAQLEADYRFTNKVYYSKGKIYLQLILYPFGKFILNYLLKLGFLDGFTGLSYAILMSFHSILVRIYLYEKYFLN